MKTNFLKPGTIVLVDYKDFSNNTQRGFFCILYDEQLDSANNFKGNFIGIKITTSFSMITNYCIPINKSNNSFLSENCMALCSKPQVLDKSQVVKVIGTLDSYTLRQVYKCYRRFESELERQMEDYI